jgi:glucan endo-1,3-alpha-glucosidase
MTKREDKLGESSFDELAMGVADGTLSRSTALKALFAAVLGGVFSIFALPSRNADASLRPTLSVNYSQTSTPPPSRSGRPRVFSHWHTPVQPANTLNAYRAEIRKAQAMGVDGFAYNITPGLTKWTNTYRARIDMLYRAASEAGDFYLFPSVDMCCSNDRTWVDTVMLYRYNDPARLKVDGLPVGQTWIGHNQAPSGTSSNPVVGWKRVLDAYAARGKPIYFIPHFAPNGDFTQRSVNGVYDRFPYTDGLYNFAAFAEGDDQLAGVRHNTFYDVAAERRGRDAMAGAAPVFNRHSDTGQYGNRIVGDFEGFHTWLEEWRGIVREQPRFVETVTWNDYLEGTYIGGPYPGQLPTNSAGNDLDHAAYRKLAEYYIEWYKTGTKPTITTDTIAIAHRLHTKNAVASGDPLPKQRGWEKVEDRLYGAVILKKPARIRLKSGNTSRTFDMAAGVHEVSMPFAKGTQRIILLRDGQTRLVATSSKPIDNDIIRYNFNYNTAWAAH